LAGRYKKTTEARKRKREEEEGIDDFSLFALPFSLFTK